jgi:hypothetical protein
VFQAIENAGQYTQPLGATKARRAGHKTTFMLLAQVRRSVEWDEYSPRVAYLP